MIWDQGQENLTSLQVRTYMIVQTPQQQAHNPYIINWQCSLCLMHTWHVQHQAMFNNTELKQIIEIPNDQDKSLGPCNL